jgi:hypothetical protein
MDDFFVSLYKGFMQPLYFSVSVSFLSFFLSGGLQFSFVTKTFNPWFIYLIEPM